MGQKKDTKAPQFKTIEEAQVLVDGLFTENEKAKATIEELSALLKEQGAKITELEVKSKQGGASKLTIKIGKKVFEINSGAKVNGKPFTPAELAEDTDAASLVLEIEGQTILTEIDK